MENGLFRHSGKHDPYVKWQKNIFRFVIVFATALLAWGGADDLDKFVALIGSFACIPLVYMYPVCDDSLRGYLFWMRCANWFFLATSSYACLSYNEAGEDDGYWTVCLWVGGYGLYYLFDLEELGDEVGWRYVYALGLFACVEGRWGSVGGEVDIVEKRSAEGSVPRGLVGCYPDLWVPIDDI